jgi:hypothetical protein
MYKDTNRYCCNLPRQGAIPAYINTEQGYNKGTTVQPFFHGNQSFIPPEHHDDFLQFRIDECPSTAAHHGEAYLIELSYLESPCSLCA